MHSLTTLPVEILPLILSNLQKKDVYQCMHVCKLWYYVGSTIYHQEIQVTRGHKQFLELTERVRINGTNLGDMVKHICFKSILVYSEDLLTEMEFHRLMNNLPRLQTIKSDGRYINYLTTVSTSCLKQIEEISLFACFMNKTVCDAHFLANVRLADKITTLKLENTQIRQTDELLLALSGLKCLKNLDITHEAQEEEEEDIFEEELHLTSILNACSNLESLVFYSRFDWEITATTPYPLSKLTRLKLDVLELTDQHVECIMECAPNLRKLELLVRDMTLEEIADELKPAVLKRFAEYLRKLEQLYFQGRELTEEEVNQDDAMWNFIGEPSRDEDLHFSLHLSEYPYEQTTLQKQAKALKITYHPIDSSWIAPLVRLTVKTMDIYISVDYYGIGLQSNFTVPFLQQLSLQQYQTCSLDITSPELVVKFKTDSNHGYIEGVVFQNETVRYLGQLYPSIESLVLKNCNLDKETHVLDLTPFVNLVKLTLDLERFSSTYVRLTRIKDPSSNEYYQKMGDQFIYLGNRLNDAVVSSSFVLDITHVRIEQLINFQSLA